MDKEALKSRLYRLETRDGQQTWVEKCQGFPAFRKQDNIFKLKYYSMPNREIFYEITVNSNIYFSRNQNGIQWTQIIQNQVMAISFKEDFGANAFWQLIEQYRKNYAVTVTANMDTLFYFQYRVPDPTVNNIEEVYIQLASIPQIQRHQRIVSIFLTKRQLLPKLGTVFKKLQEQKDLKKLQIIFEIIKILFNSSNQQMLLELMSNQYFMFILGALEYDPNFKNCKPEHRKFMKQEAKLIQVVPFRNNQLLNLVLFTYRLQYVKQCVLYPYITDYALSCTTYIIKNNYKKIITLIFDPKKKDFINNLFDLLRNQQLMAYKLLRQIFQISKKSLNIDDLYLQIAERDFFQIMIRNMKQQQGIDINNNTNNNNNKNKKKKTIQYLSEIINICIQILQQFMENQPMHFKNFCISQNQHISKYPTIQFLMDRYQSSPLHVGEKIGKIFCQLIGSDDYHPIKSITHEKIYKKFISLTLIDQFVKWAPVFSKIVKPLNSTVSDDLENILSLLINKAFQGPKNHQITMLNILKDIKLQNIQIHMLNILSIIQQKIMGTLGLDKVLFYQSLFLKDTHNLHAQFYKNYKNYQYKKQDLQIIQKQYKKLYKNHRYHYQII